MVPKRVNVNSIVAGYSPRRNYKGKEELKGSIEKQGLIEPLLVRTNGDIYAIIDGNRRFRAIKELGWTSVDCIIEDADEEKSYCISYIRNTQRENFNPIEESIHLQTVIDKFGYNVEGLVRNGYAPHRSTIDDKLRLLSLPEDMQQSIVDGRLDPSKGYELGRVKDVKFQRELFDKAIEKDMPVRELQREIQSRNVRRKREEEGNLCQVEIPQGDIPGVFFKDSRDMSELPDERVSLILTSPGYCVGMEYEQGVILKDHLKNLKQHCREWNRVLMRGGRVAVNFGDIHNFRTQNGGKVEIQLMGHYYQTFLRKYNIRLSDIVTWRKGKTWVNNPQVSYHHKTKHTSYRILNNFEYIYVFYKEGIREVPADIENESKISKEEWKEWVDGVWEIPPVRNQKGHPAQFPEEIPRRLIRMYSWKGDIVLDPFGGSMTTVKVANELGRIGIGYEKEEKYKPVIMEKLGIKEEDLKKPEVEEGQGAQGGTPHTLDQLEKTISDMLAENNKTPKDIASVRIPLKPDLAKDEIEIEWVNDDEEPDSPGPTASPRLLRADDYDGQEAISEVFHTCGSKEGARLPIQEDNTLLIPERCSPQIPHLNSIILGDCVEKLKNLPDNSADLIATDPPYGIKFMGKNWDKAVPTVEVWKEALRVLKPGACAFVMSIPRQDCQSRMIRNLEEAGFKVGFSPIYWAYAQGFPKASNISKAIDKRCGAERIKARRNPNSRENCDKTNTIYESGTVGKTAYLTKPATSEAKKFDGSYGGFQPKPAVEVILVAMKPTDEKTYVDQALKNGKGITWLDDCRIPYADDGDKSEYAFNVDGNQRTRKAPGEKLRLFDGGWKVDKTNKDMPEGRFPANLLISDDILEDKEKHPGGSFPARRSKTAHFGLSEKESKRVGPIGDNGGFSRFFSLDAWAERNLPFLVVPKARKKEKNAGLESRHESVVGDGRKKPIDNAFQRGKTPRKNTHPTVKPIKLMAYLITMGSREGQVVLDIFCGSGSTCVAAKMLNRKFIGIELDEEYHEIAEKRVKNAAMKKAA